MGYSIWYFKSCFKCYTTFKIRFPRKIVRVQTWKLLKKNWVVILPNWYPRGSPALPIPSFCPRGSPPDPRNDFWPSENLSGYPTHWHLKFRIDTRFEIFMLKIPSEDPIKYPHLTCRKILRTTRLYTPNAGIRCAPFNVCIAIRF